MFKMVGTNVKKKIYYRVTTAAYPRKQRGSCPQGRIQDFGQGGTRILGTKILSKFKNKKFEIRDKICAQNL